MIDSKLNAKMHKEGVGEYSVVSAIDAPFLTLICDRKQMIKQTPFSSTVFMQIDK